MITINHVSKQYGTKTALSQVNLEIGSGEIIGLFGENGAGKTTLMKSILGFIRYEGSILLDGEPITRKNIERLSFATSEHSFFPNLTAEGNASFYADHFPKFNRVRYEGLMKFFELPRHKKLSAFSTGQKNQFEVILALCQGADYILMDEPFAGNDLFNREDFYRLLMGILEDHETILLSTHLIEEVSGFIDRAVLIHDGEIIGDRQVMELEEEGIALVDYVKESYHYRPDRVGHALAEITGKEV